MGFERIWHKGYPKGVPAELTFDETVMPEILTKTAGRFPDRDALIFMGTRIAYRELDALVNRFARALTSLGVAKGDKVAMLLPNVPQIVIADYATFRIGGAVVMNNPLYTEHELAYQLNDSDSKVLITLDMLFPMAMKLKATTKLEHVVICRIGDYLPEALKPLFPPVEFEKQEGVHLFMDLLNAQSGAPVANAAGWDDVGALMYTGGTTGVSKGVMLTHANISRNTQQLRYWFPTLKDGEESMLAIFPFFHSAGWTGMQNMCILAGWTDILVPKPEPDAIVYLLENFKPSLLPGVPTVYIGLLNNEKFRKLDFSFLKAFMAGAAPLAVETIRQLKALKDVPIINVYGLTEICPMGTATPWGGYEKPGTVGVPLPSTDLKIVDLATGKQEMENGKEGEICFKGPQVMKGYYKRPEETAIALKDGWLYTGDIGFLDADGYLTIVDRKKDLIVASGYNIYPKEIDELLMEHPKVMEVCTIGVPDAYRGETVKTFVVVRPGQTMTADEVTAFCRERLAPYKVPKLIAFIDALPKSTVGKILRRELREMEAKKTG
ncbi:MAG TPA: long-chain fatty acid--CoA ligase [Syntrophales bacterium]|nr:long-chain fatty acid--CoA ligase [Syntrophales bacterium]